MTDKSVILAVAIGVLTLAFAWSKFKTKNMAEPNQPPPEQTEEESHDSQGSLSEDEMPQLESEEAEDEITELTVDANTLGCQHYRRACMK